MPNCDSLQTVDVCTRAAFRLATSLAFFAFAAAPAAAQVGGPVKVGFYNIQSGKGEPGLSGHPTPFADTSNCTDASQPLNAWGIGFVQQELTVRIGNDPAVIALGLAEAWTAVCASPENVRKALGWKARSDSDNGLAIIARHGFSGAVTVLKLDTSQSTNAEPRYVKHAKVCVDAACGTTLDVFVTHMYASGALRNESMTTQVKQILSFMTQQAGARPRAVLGDFNLYEEFEPTCGSSSWPASILDNLRNAGYADAWRTLKGPAPGYTGMTNRPGCGSPEGSTYKRIDYSWSLDLTPVAVSLFGVVPPGDPAPSDHYGILAEYSFDGPIPEPDVAGPDVAITAPASGAEVSGVVTVSASASDPSGVSRVEFFADGAALGADSSAPYSASWDTRTLADGPHTLQARAFDTLGNSSLSGLPTVTVKNAAPDPTDPSDPGTGVVTAYDATTDRAARPEPPLPLIGGAGFQFADPTFGTPLLRVTDGQTRPVAADRSFKTPSAAHQTAWNTTSKYFYVLNSGGNIVPFAFDAATMTASRINPSGSGDGGLMLDFFGEPQFSYVEENLIYGPHKTQPRTIHQYDFASNTYSPLLDLQTLGADLSGTYTGGIISSGGPVEKILVWYGGAGQDKHFRVVVFERADPSRRRLLDTLASTVDGQPTSTPLNFKLHHVELDRSGRYVLLSPTTADRQAPRYAKVEYVWDLQTDVITPLDDVEDIAGGHKALGFGMMLNKGCCTSSTWDAAQWQIRSLATPTVTRDLIAPVLLPKEIYLSDHASWNNAQRSQLVPFVSALYRYGNNPVEWRAWDDEIVAVRTEEGAATTVWRFAHHRSNVGSDADPLQPYFWYMPRLNVSQNGRWAIFTSNWEKTLGVDPVNSERRQDVFLVKLAGTSPPADPPDPIPNQPPTVAITLPAPATVMTAGASVTVAADAADSDGSVVRVDFFANGSAIGSAAAAPFAIAWQVPAVGSYILSAVAIDDDGASTASETVAASAVAPVKIVTASIPGGRVGDAYAAALEAAGGLGFYIWGVTAGSLPPGIALDASGLLSGVPAASGSWTFTATARDADDDERFGSRSFTLAVGASNQAPTVSITTPSDGSLVAVRATVMVTAAPADADGLIQRVDFYANGTLIGSRATAPWSVEWIPSFASSVNLSVVAIDDEGAGGSSPVVAVRVMNDVVMYAGDATVVVGNYQFVSDATAAGGRRLWNPNKGAARVKDPLAKPGSYIEFTFHAEAGRPYHLWIRGRADSNNWANDAAFVQFSGTVNAAGAAVDRIGTSDGAVYQVEEGTNAKLSNWGWQDTSYGGFADPFYFETTGPQRIRLQPREDGLSIDQIVISPVTYLEVRPGATKNDATIVAK